MCTYGIHVHMCMHNFVLYNSFSTCTVHVCACRLNDLMYTYIYSLQDMLERMEIAALLISAAIHDLDHPGRTNPYLCNIKHELATLYNDR